jgi:hypothetical protein
MMTTVASPVAAVSQTKALSSLQKTVQIGRPTAFPLRKVVSRAPVAKSTVRASAEEAAPSKKFEKALVAGVLTALSLGCVADAKAFDIGSVQNRPSAEKILQKAKADGDANFAEAQRSGKETTGSQETPSKGAYPFGRQESASRGFNTSTKEEGVSGSVGSSANSDAVEARAEQSANSPGTNEQQGSEQSPQGTLQKVFSKGVRGAVGQVPDGEDKTGAVSREGRQEVAKAGQADTYVQGPQLADRIKDAFTSKTEEGKTAAGDAVEKAARATGVSTSAPELNQTATVAGVFDFGGKAEGAKDAATSALGDAKGAVKNIVPNVKDAIPDSIPNPAADANSQVSKVKSFADSQIGDFKADVAKIRAENKERVGFPDAPSLAQNTDNASGKGTKADYSY